MVRGVRGGGVAGLRGATAREHQRRKEAEGGIPIFHFRQQVVPKREERCACIRVRPTARGRWEHTAGGGEAAGAVGGAGEEQHKGPLGEVHRGRGPNTTSCKARGMVETLRTRGKKAGRFFAEFAASILV